MQPQSSTGDAVPVDGVLTLTGYNVVVRVQQGALFVRDGIGANHRDATFPKHTKLRRLIIIASRGYVTLDALSWLRQRDCSFVQIDSMGNVIAASGPDGLADASLRRAQVFAGLSGTGHAIARDLLTAKLAGQASILDTMNPDGAARVRSLTASLDSAPDLDTMRLIEAQAAALYWQAWSTVPVRFARKARDWFPAHWRTFGIRASPLSDTPRRAITPINSLLNFSYAVLTSEAIIALRRAGLDPAIGIVHVDMRGRQSFALDLMEPVRPAVDRFILDLLSARVFGIHDVIEARDGECRLLSPVKKPLTEMALQWAALLAPFVSRIVARLQHEPTETLTIPRAGVPRALTMVCQHCGAAVPAPDRTLCDACAAAHRQTAIHAIGGLATLAERRADGTDPAHGGAAGIARGSRNAAHVAAAKAYDAAHPADSTLDFARDVLPGLRHVTVRAMADATGLTQGYCSFVRRGLRIPHRRHWQTLLALTVTGDAP